MGLFLSLAKSLKKSRKLAKLQRQIHPPNETANDMVNEALKDMLGGGGNRRQRERYLEEFLDLCVSDKGVKAVIDKYGLDKDDLREIYSNLLIGGLGQYIKGHFAALSTIAYHEPLLYVVKSEQANVSRAEIMSNLLSYWNNDIPQGGLVKLHSECP